DLRRNAKRVYPPACSPAGGVIEDPPLAVLGRWGTLEPEVARARARAELCLPDDRSCSECEIDELRSLTAKRIYQPSPMSGLERASGTVLAVDAIDPYGMGGFLPPLHTFTPGSTMKVVVMASALEQGVVRPDESFDTFNGHLHLGTREIHEAEGDHHTGWITA